jgi:hypothetical protein
MAGIGAQLSILHAAGMSEFAPKETFITSPTNRCISEKAVIRARLLPDLILKGALYCLMICRL